MTLLVVSACGGSSDGGSKKAEPSQPKAGQCIAKEVPDGSDVAPDTQAVVPCNKDHVYEIVAVVDIPDELLAGKTDKEKLARRTALADVDDNKSELRQALGSQIYPLCDEPFRAASGLSGHTVRDKSAKDVDLRPARSNALEWFTLTSPDLWLSGTTKMVCSYRFTSADRTDDEIAPTLPAKSTNTKRAMASYLTKDFPISLRSCIAEDDSHSCTVQHQQEPLWILDVKAVYGKGFLSGADFNNVSPDQFAKIAKACTEVYTQTGGTISARTEMGWRYYDDVSTTDKSVPIICSLKSKDNVGFRNFAAYQ